MREVEAESFFIIVGTGLVDMRSEHFPECRLQQMRRGMVLPDRCPSVCIDSQRHFVMHTENTGYDMADMADLVALQRDDIFDGKLRTVRQCDHAGIVLLSALCCIEGGLRSDDRAAVSLRTALP